MNKDKLKEFQKNNPFLSLGDVLYTYLRDEIIYLRMPPGSRINETQLATQLEISRSPVKYAIERLCSESFMERDARRKTKVVPLRIDDYLYIIDARIAVEGRAAFLAAKNANTCELREIHSILDEFDAAKSCGDHKAWSECDDRFHRKVISASHNTYLHQMYNQYYPKILRYRNYVSHTFQLRESNVMQEIPSNYHRAIFAALKMHLSTVAMTEMENDINRMRANVYFFLRS